MTASILTSDHRGNLAGILAILAGSLGFVINDSQVKMLGGSLPVGEIMLLRGVLALTLLLPVAAWMGAFKVPIGLMLRPAFGWRLVGELGSTFAFIFALMHMRFADLSGIQQVQPIAVTAASAAFLAQPVGWRRWLAALVGLMGVLLIVKPGTGAFEPYAILAFICVLFVVLRDLGTRAVPAGVPSMLLASASAGTVMAGGLLLKPAEIWVVPRPLDFAMLAIAALFLVAGYLLITIAVRIGELAVVVPFRYSSVIFAVVLQWAIWSTLPDTLALLGMGIVVAAGLYTFHREQVRLAGRN
jgi:drug/metabolite transporter (DMT)-like permease